MKSLKKARRHILWRASVSPNVATPVPHPRSPKAARGDSSGSTERPKRGLPRIDRPLFGRSSEPNAPVKSFWQLRIGSGRRISGVPGVR
jgi:hypothetical protein